MFLLTLPADVGTSRQCQYPLISTTAVNVLGPVAFFQPLCDGTWVNTLWQSVKAAKDEGIADFVEFYCQLWRALEQTAGEDTGGLPQGVLLPYLNALAFGAKGFLPACWR